jgi:hypothetical protein
VPIGLNQNIEVDGHTFHVQTEDVPDRSEVVSQAFLGGRVLHTFTTSYSEWKEVPGWEKRVADQASRQHSVMVAAAMRGRFTEKI